MKTNKINMLLTLCFLTLTYAHANNLSHETQNYNDGWVQVASFKNTAQNVKIVVAKDDTAFATFGDDGSTELPYGVLQIKGDHTTQLGVPFILPYGSGASDQPNMDLVVDKNGDPYFAYSILDKHNKGLLISVLTYKNNKWNLLGNPNQMHGTSLELAISQDNTPYLAFADSQKNNQLHVVKYNNGYWNTYHEGASNKFSWFNFTQSNDFKIQAMTYIDPHASPSSYHVRVINMSNMRLPNNGACIGSPCETPSFLEKPILLTGLGVKGDDVRIVYLVSPNRIIINKPEAGKWINTEFHKNVNNAAENTSFAVMNKKLYMAAREHGNLNIYQVMDDNDILVGSFPVNDRDQNITLQNVNNTLYCTYLNNNNHYVIMKLK